MSDSLLHPMSPHVLRTKSIHLAIPNGHSASLARLPQFSQLVFQIQCGRSGGLRMPGARIPHTGIHILNIVPTSFPKVNAPQFGLLCKQRTDPPRIRDGYPISSIPVISVSEPRALEIIERHRFSPIWQTILVWILEAFHPSIDISPACREYQYAAFSKI